VVAGLFVLFCGLLVSINFGAMDVDKEESFSDGLWLRVAGMIFPLHMGHHNCTSPRHAKEDRLVDECCNGYPFLESSQRFWQVKISAGLEAGEMQSDYMSINPSFLSTYQRFYCVRRSYISSRRSRLEHCSNNRYHKRSHIFY
jgi:hypothetical protein